MNDDTQTEPTGLKRRSVGRRDILKLGATSTVLPAMLGPVSLTERDLVAITKPKVSAAGEAPSGSISLGFWNGDPDTLVANARDLKAGDAKLAKTGAEIQMIGMGQGGDLAGQTRLRSLAVDMTFGVTPFRAWQYENSGVENVSSPSTFSLPVDSKQGLLFRVTAAYQGLSGTPGTRQVRLTPGKDATLAKLQPGYYVLAIGKAGRSLRVNWAAYEIAGDSTGQSFSLRKNGKPVNDFAYLIFTIGPKQPDHSRFV